jgi:hypothetical protein
VVERAFLLSIPINITRANTGLALIATGLAVAGLADTAYKEKAYIRKTKGRFSRPLFCFGLKVILYHKKMRRAFMR